MNKTGLKGNGDEQKGNSKQKFESHTENDLVFEKIEEEEMYDNLQIKLGRIKEELRKIIKREFDINSTS
jgi:hypothetical protein